MSSKTAITILPSAKVLSTVLITLDRADCGVALPERMLVFMQRVPLHGLLLDLPVDQSFQSLEQERGERDGPKRPRSSQGLQTNARQD